MSLLSTQLLEALKDEKLLLAFSAGADSTALFFCLLEHHIPFDIAIVNYAVRPQARQECDYAKALAKEHGLQCHLLDAPGIEQNFEKKARQVRYDFFESLIRTHAYTLLLTAHHLQDRLEWMLMQLSKGAGTAELLGMKEFEKRDNYTLCRPLLNTTKEEILSYLRHNKRHWFHDTSNDDLSYKRNYFRHKIAQELIKENSEGIKQSFKYMQEDISELIKEVQVHEAGELSLFISSGHRRSDIFHIDKILKKKGQLLSASQREELKRAAEIVAGRKFLVSLHKEVYCIAPYLQENMDKAFKEKCRILGVPVKLRPYLFKDPSAFALFTRFISCDTP